MARIEIDPNYSSPTFPRATAGPDLFKKEDIQSMAAALSTHVHEGVKGHLLDVAGSIPGASLAVGSVTSAQITNGTILGGDIANGAISSTQIATGGIVATNLAAGAISSSAIASGGTPNPTLTSASMTDCPEMTISLTGTGAEDALIWFGITLSHSAINTYVGIQINMNGVDQGVVMAGMSPGANGLFMLSNMLRIPLIAGTVTFKGRWANLQGTGTLTGNNIARLILGMAVRR